MPTLAVQCGDLFVLRLSYPIGTAKSIASIDPATSSIQIP
jgi:hypothetical protein